MDADVVLIDVGPNLGAINRAALLAADFVVVPLAADLYSLQGLRNLGPTLRQWRKQWRRVLEGTEEMSLPISLPKGSMKPAGYVVMQHVVRLDRVVKAYDKWLQRIPTVYQDVVLGGDDAGILFKESYCLASLRNYRSLMPMAQEARKPMFDLTSKDGAIGSHAALVKTCYNEFEALARRIAEVCGVPD